MALWFSKPRKVRSSWGGGQDGGGQGCGLRVDVTVGRSFRQEACWGTLGAGPGLEGLPRAGDSLLVRVPQRNSTKPLETVRCVFLSCGKRMRTMPFWEHQKEQGQ